MASDPQAERIRLVIEPPDDGGDRAQDGDPDGHVRPEDTIDLGRLEDEMEYEFEDEDGEGRPRRRLLLPLGLASLALAGFGAITWYAYQNVMGGADEEMMPLIQADAGPIKTRPASPGGLEVPYQDKLVLNQMSPDPSKPQVERLLPPQEVPKPPVLKPEALPAAAPTTQGQAAAESQAAAPVPTVAAPAPKALAPKVTAAGPVKKTEDAAKTAPANASGGLAPAAGSETAAPATPAVAAPKAAQVETLLPPKAAAPKAPEPKMPKATQTAAIAGGYLVQFASLKDKRLAGGEWVRLQKAFPTLLKDKKMVLQQADLGSRGIFHRVRAGYFADRAAAAALCQAIKAKNQACIVIKP